MIKPTKLTEQELQELQNFQTKSEKLIAQLGQVFFQKNRIEIEEQYLKQQQERLLEEEIQVSKQLKEKYGEKVEIDIVTGNIIYT
jgi:hypothetical protein